MKGIFNVVIQVIAILLEESLAEENRNDEGKKKSNIYISEAFTELGQVPFLQGNVILCFSKKGFFLSPINKSKKCLTVSFV